MPCFIFPLTVTVTVRVRDSIPQSLHPRADESTVTVTATVTVTEGSRARRSDMLGSPNKIGRVKNALI
jgi:hypothetical protein